MAFFLNEIRIEGIPVEQMLSCHISSGAGQHGYLEMTAYIADQDEVLFRLEVRQQIHLYLDKNGKKYPLFYGIVTQKEITCSGDLLILQINAASLSYLMDIKKRSRSFQNRQMRYSELLMQIFGEYEGACCQACFPDQELGTWLIQYEETDWAFLNRMMSRLNTMLTPAVSSRGLSVYAGVAGKERVNIPHTVRLMNKDLYTYYEMKANGQEVSAADYTKYQIESAVLLEIFDQVSVDGSGFVVRSSQLDFGNEQLTATYLLMKKEGIKTLPVEQYGITGVALSGVIAAAEQDQVQVQLDIDSDDQSVPEFWLPFSTAAAAGDGSGWYCMPEPGDLVNVYFPTRDVAQAIVLNAVSGYLTPQGAEDKMGNVRRVYLSTVQDEKLILDSSGATIATAGEKAYIRAGADGTISLYASQWMDILSSGDLTIQAANRIEMGFEKLAGFYDEKFIAAVVANEDGSVLMTGETTQTSED